MSLHIIGIGTAVPQHHITQEHAAMLARQFSDQVDGHDKVMTSLYRRSGVKIRHSVVLTSSSNSVPPQQSFFVPVRSRADRGPTTGARMSRYEIAAGPLARAAAENALTRAQVNAAEITHLITVSCTGFRAPGFDLTLVHDLGLAATTARTHIGFMGCHAALNGLRVAKAFADADSKTCVLLCAVELCSLHQRYGWGPEQVVANSLFADGAAAVIAQGNRSHDTATTPVGQLLASGSMVLSNSASLMQWRVGDNGFEMALSPRIPDVIRHELRPWLGRWLAAQDLSTEQIGAWAIHPGGPRILHACGDAIGLTPDQLAPSRHVLANYGNMSSPTVLFILDHLCRHNAPRPCVLLGFGPGLTIEAALLA